MAPNCVNKLNEMNVPSPARKIQKVSLKVSRLNNSRNSLKIRQNGKWHSNVSRASFLKTSNLHATRSRGVVSVRSLPSWTKFLWGWFNEMPRIIVGGGQQHDTRRETPAQLRHLHLHCTRRLNGRSDSVSACLSML